MYLQKLMLTLKIPKEIYNKGNKQLWEELTHAHQYNFPQEYMDFIDIYGTGSIGDFLWILNPFENNNENINLFEKSKIMRDSYNYLKKNHPKDFKYSIYPDDNGLFPWALTDNGDELYYDTAGNIVVVMPSRCRDSDALIYEMDIAEFLYKLLMNEIHCDCFSAQDFCGISIEYQPVKF